MRIYIDKIDKLPNGEYRIVIVAPRFEGSVAAYGLMRRLVAEREEKVEEMATEAILQMIEEELALEE